MMTVDDPREQLFLSFSGTWRDRGVVFKKKGAYGFLRQAGFGDMEKYWQARSIYNVGIRIQGQEFVFSIEDHSCDRTSYDACAFARLKKGNITSLKAAAGRVSSPEDVQVFGVGGDGSVAFTLQPVRFERVEPVAQEAWETTGKPDVANSPASVQSASNVSKSAASSDPLGTLCEKNGKGYYDCTCVVEKSAVIKKEYQTGTSTEQKRLFSERARMQACLEKNKSAYHCKNGLERVNSQLAAIKAGTYPSDDDMYGLVVDRFGCKDGKQFQRKSYLECKASAHYSHNVADPDAYCSCAAEKAADSWVNGEANRINSKLMVRYQSQARTACKGMPSSTIGIEKESVQTKQSSPKKEVPSKMLQSDNSLSEFEKVKQVGSDFGKKTQEAAKAAADKIKEGFGSFFK